MFMAMLGTDCPTANTPATTWTCYETPLIPVPGFPGNSGTGIYRFPYQDRQTGLTPHNQKFRDHKPCKRKSFPPHNNLGVHLWLCATLGSRG